MKKSDLKEYSKPSITEYGKIEDITETKGRTGGDGGSKTGSLIK